MQTKKGSFQEACINTFIGFLITLICSPFVYHLCGIKTSPFQLGLATFYFTVISVARSYIIRRFFNGLKPKEKKKKPTLSDDSCPGHSYVRISTGSACQYCGELEGKF